MKLRSTLCLLVFVCALVVISARKGRKKNKKSPPEWKSSSMPFQNKRFESVSEGKDLTLDCKAQGHPRPTVTWTKDGNPVNEDDPSITVRKFNLVMKKLTADMAGNYTCIASNKHGALEWTFHLDVQVKLWPLEVDGPNNLTSMAGSSAAFQCRVLNDPKATIRWQRQPKATSGEEITANSEFLPDGADPQVLILNNVQKEDEGLYRCMAGNIWGLKYADAYLTVLEPALEVLPTETYETRRGTMFPAFDPYNPDTIGPGDPYFTDIYRNNDNDIDNIDEDDGLGPFDFGPALYYTTTKRPRNRNNNRRKNGKKKDRKKDRNNKQKNYVSEDDDDDDNDFNMVEEVAPSTTTPYFVMPVMTTTKPPAPTDDDSQTQHPVIWNFDSNNNDGVRDTRYNNLAPAEEDPVGEEAETGSAKSGEDESVPGSISSWTIYTIVGALGGVILLIGLIAITLTLCCKREEGGVYKSTPV